MLLWSGGQWNPPPTPCVSVQGKIFNVFNLFNLQEMDIDDILRGAETREADDHPQTVGEELLSQFKV